MLVPYAQAALFLSSIVKAFRTFKNRILVLPAHSVSGLCAGRILCSLLDREGVAHSVVPVANYTDVAAAVDSFIADGLSSGLDAAVHSSSSSSSGFGPAPPHLSPVAVSLVFIDCGGTIDLSSFLRLSAPSRSSVTAYVVDSARPLHTSFSDSAPEPRVATRLRALLAPEERAADVPSGMTAELLATEEEDEAMGSSQGFAHSHSSSRGRGDSGDGEVEDDDFVVNDGGDYGFDDDAVASGAGAGVGTGAGAGAGAGVSVEDAFDMEWGDGVDDYDGAAAAVSTAGAGDNDDEELEEHKERSRYVDDDDDNYDDGEGNYGGYSKQPGRENAATVDDASDEDNDSYNDDDDEEEDEDGSGAGAGAGKSKRKGRKRARQLNPFGFGDGDDEELGLHDDGSSSHSYSVAGAGAGAGMGTGSKSKGKAGTGSGAPKRARASLGDAHHGGASALHQAQERARRRQQRKEIREELDRYYSVSRRSLPSALLLRKLAIASMPSSSAAEVAWLAAVAISDAFLSANVTEREYIALKDTLVLQAQSGGRWGRGQSGFTDSDSAATPASAAAGAGAGPGAVGSDGIVDLDADTPLMSKPIGSVTVSSELRFPLLEHWTLFEAMETTPQVATHLKVWSEQGIMDLKSALARMRVPLAEAQRPFVLATDASKREFRFRLAHFCDDLGLHSPTITSFLRQHSASLLVSALDTALALAALLETRPGMLPSICSGSGAGMGGAGAGAGRGSRGAGSHVNEIIQAANDAARKAAAAPDAVALAAASAAASVASTGGGAPPIPPSLSAATAAAALAPPRQAYWSAHDSLSPSGAPTLRLGLALACDVQRAVVRQAVSMLKRREVDMRALVHYALVDSSSDLALFAQPAAAGRLAAFLVGLIGARRASCPLVLAVLVPAADAYLVVGVNGLRNAPCARGATALGRAMRLAVERSGARARRDGFDGTVMHVQRQDVRRLLEQLIIVATGTVSLQV